MYMNIFNPIWCYLFYPYIIVSRPSGTGNTSNTTQDTSTSSKQGTCIVINPRSVTWAGYSSYFTVFCACVCVCLSASTVFSKMAVSYSSKVGNIALLSTKTNLGFVLKPLDI